MLDGDRARIEVSAHDDDRLRLVATDDPDKIAYRPEYWLLLLVVTQVDVRYVGFEGLVGCLYE